MATATPEQVHPGDVVTINPGSAVERNCTDIVGVYDFDDVILGQVIGGTQWEPASSSGAPPTWLTCQGDITNLSMDIVVPPLPDGGYRFCISVVVDFVGCASVFVAEPTTPVAGDAAVWTLTPDEILTPDAHSFTALVTRLGCNGGVTGDVHAPTMLIDDANIVVTFTVRASPGGRCPTNDQVPYVVDVGQPIGERRLVDGSCLLDGEAASTSWCSNGGVRY